MKNPSILDSISIVLVDTKTPANIGSVARSMMNMGISDLLLVNPPEDRNRDALRLAAGADRILEQARRHSTLREAIEGHHRVIGASRHRGRLRGALLTPREASARISALPAGARVAIVFGSEVNGLENDDLALCQDLVAIPSSEEFPSLNLSQAVMIIVYELFLAAHGNPTAPTGKLAPSEELEQLYRHMQKSLLSIGFLDQVNAIRMMRALRRIFNRAHLESRDIAILHGLLSRIDYGAGPNIASGSNKKAE